MSDSFRERLGEWLRTTLTKPASQDAVQTLDRALAQMDAALREARAVVATTTGTDRESLEASLRGLDEKRAQAKVRRDEIAARHERVERVKALTVELAALNERAVLLSQEELAGEPGKPIRARAAEIRAAVDAITREQ